MDLENKLQNEKAENENQRNKVKALERYLGELQLKHDKS